MSPAPSMVRALVALAVVLPATLGSSCDFEPDCRRGEQHRLAIPCEGKCAFYIECDDGVPMEKKCGKFLWHQNQFDAATLQCVRNADCDWWLHSTASTSTPFTTITTPTPTPSTTDEPTTTPTSVPSTNSTAALTSTPTEITTETSPSTATTGTTPYNTTTSDAGTTTTTPVTPTTDSPSGAQSPAATIVTVAMASTALQILTLRLI